jgi:hypothetical protein
MMKVVFEQQYLGSHFIERQELTKTESIGERAMSESVPVGCGWVMPNVLHDLIRLGNNQASNDGISAETFARDLLPG